MLIHSRIFLHNLFRSSFAINIWSSLWLHHLQLFLLQASCNILFVCVRMYFEWLRRDDRHLLGEKMPTRSIRSYMHVLLIFLRPTNYALKLLKLVREERPSQGQLVSNYSYYFQLCNISRTCSYLFSTYQYFVLSTTQVNRPFFFSFFSFVLYCMPLLSF